MDYQQELEHLVTARTDQIRTLYVTQERVIAALKEGQTAKSLMDAKNAIGRALEEFERLGTLRMENNQPARFGGEPGTPVPQVDPEDLRKVFEYGREVAKERPKTASGVSIYEHMLGKPQDHVLAVCYRASMLGLITTCAKDVLPLPPVSQEALFRAMATVEMEWMAAGVPHEGPPFDWEQFLQLCA
jgi:hypothetical protein